MRILITGVAGFIGFHVARKLLQDKTNKIVGIDNINKYYDPSLKIKRLKILKTSKNFFFKKINIVNKKNLFFFLKTKKIDYIIHLAAQAGVRHSLKFPQDYVDSNILGFFNILEFSRLFKVKHLLFASTSSVYGLNENFPFKENKVADHPIQFYAATKKSNEIMAHSYSYLYNLPVTACRFFTVYGPWGRPDMALFKFTKNILNNKKINLFNYGNHSRDFTYCDDLAILIEKLIFKVPKKNKKFNKKIPEPGISPSPFQVLNISSGKRVKLLCFVKELEKQLKVEAKINFCPMQKGDIKDTLSSRNKIKKYINVPKSTNYKIGIEKFVTWYKSYYHSHT
jgi:UDP-glucuronate 4-epimerase